MRHQVPCPALIVTFLRRFSSWRTLLFLILAPALIGCQEERKPFSSLEPSIVKPKQFDPIGIRPLENVATGEVEKPPISPVMQPLPPHASAVAGLTQARSSDMAGAMYRIEGEGVTYSEGEYVQKADLYWKLNWLRKELLKGNIPSILAASLPRLRKQLAKSKHDAVYRLTVEALDHLEKGLAHVRAEKAILAVGAHCDSIPWGAGTDSIQRYIDRGELGFGRKPVELRSHRDMSEEDDEDGSSSPRRSPLLTNVLSADQKKAIDTILEYELREHTSPHTLMRDEWSKAITLINKLRDELGLKGREQNKDGDSTYANPIVRAESGEGDSGDLLPNMDGPAKR